MERTAALREEIAAGFVAGVIGAILIDLFFLATAIAGGTPLGAAIAGVYDFAASVAMGRGAFTRPGSGIPLGVLFHVVVAVAWAYGFVYLTRSQPHLLRRPAISGLGFGAVVFVIMNVMLVAAGLFEHLGSAAFGIGFLGSVVFYGLPVGLVVARMLPHRSANPGRAA